MAFNILVVDDSATIRKVVGRTLHLAQVPVGELVEAENGKVALEKMRQHWIDVVIADINMPIMTGVEMIDRMRAEEDLRSLPVIIISTEGSATRIEELRSKGVKAYIRKPFTPEQVRDVLKDVLGDWSHDIEKRSA